MLVPANGEVLLPQDICAALADAPAELQETLFAVHPMTD
jgi:hypothetical protein